MPEIIRPLTLEERATFAAKIGKQGVFLRIVKCVVIVVVCIGGLSALTLAIAPNLPQRQQNILLAAFFWIGIIMAFFFDKKTKYPSQSKKMVAELNEGQGLLCVFRVAEAIRVGEFEDNGYAFYLKLNNGKVLYLMGQYLYGCTEEGKFPCEEIEIVYSPKSRLVLSMKCNGKLLSPSCDLPSPTIEDFESGKIPDDGDVKDLDFESLKK